MKYCPFGFAHCAACIAAEKAHNEQGKKFRDDEIAKQEMQYIEMKRQREYAKYLYDGKWMTYDQLPESEKR